MRDSVGSESVGGSGPPPRTSRQSSSSAARARISRPLTLSAPKPIVPTVGLSFLAHLLSCVHATATASETSSSVPRSGASRGTGGGIRNVLDELAADHRRLRRRRARRTDGARSSIAAAGPRRRHRFSPGAGQRSARARCRRRCRLGRRLSGPDSSPDRPASVRRSPVTLDNLKEPIAFYENA